MKKAKDTLNEKDVSMIGKLIDTMTPELVKKALFTGAGALFLAEDGVKKTVGDFKLPRDVAQYLIRQGEKSKQELFGIVQKELNRFLSAIDITKQVKEILDGVTFEIDTKVTFRTEGDKMVTGVKSKSKVGKAKPAKRTKKT